MSDIIYPTLKDMAERMPEDAYRVFSSFEQQLAEVMLKRARAGLAKRVPVATGYLSSTLEVDKQSGRFTVGFTDPKANALDVGRKLSKPYSRQTKAGAAVRGRRGSRLGEHGTKPYQRMLGSKQPQARRGMTKSTGFSLRAQWAEIMAEAAAVADGSGVAKISRTEGAA